MTLVGKTVLVTRAKEQARELSGLIEREGGRAVEVPLIAFEAVEDTGELDEALRNLAHYKWLLFTSVNGVHFFMKRFNQLYHKRPKLPVSIAVVGEKTEAVLLSYGLKTDLLPDDYTAEGMVDALTGRIKAGDRILLVRGNRGRHVLNEAVKKMGALLHDLTVYRTIFPETAKEQLRALLQGDIMIDYVTFTSSSTVSHYTSILRELSEETGNLQQPKIACIGPIAAKTAKELGLSVHIVPETYTIEALVQQLAIDS